MLVLPGDETQAPISKDAVEHPLKARITPRYVSNRDGGLDAPVSQPRELSGTTDAKPVHSAVPHAPGWQVIAGCNPVSQQLGIRRDEHVVAPSAEVRGSRREHVTK
ncbi:hypothetical protein [uncultured Zoogloea sp.]|uniref:hypothetical protein n=1 Tax=uncultured Zoogloea sp. TaxID=160237 RepID=UPI002609C4C7|nr:hypothetical protein [uncultured Zoogloea sp.]